MCFTRKAFFSIMFLFISYICESMSVLPPRLCMDRLEMELLYCSSDDWLSLSRTIITCTGMMGGYGIACALWHTMYNKNKERLNFTIYFIYLFPKGGGRCAFATIWEKNLIHLGEVLFCPKKKQKNTSRLIAPSSLQHSSYTRDTQQNLFLNWKA